MTIVVNDVEIPEAAVNAEIQYHPAPALEAARREAAEALVVRELLTQEAVRLGISGETPEEAIEELLNREVRTPEPDEESCRRYFNGNRRRFRSPDLFEAQHVLLAAAPDELEERGAARVKAEILLSHLAENPENFEDIARQHSACPSGKSGGYLGQVTRGSTVPEFETYLFSLDENEICAAPVESRYGFHIVRLLKKQIGRDLPFEAVRGQIADYLRDSVWRTAVRQYILVLAGRASISGFEIEAAGSPLVQ